MEHLSRALANKVGGALHYPPEQIEVLAYGFFGLLQTAFLLAGTALLGWAIGAFWPCLAAVLAGSLRRRRAGRHPAGTVGIPAAAAGGISGQLCALPGGGGGPRPGRQP